MRAKNSAGEVTRSPLPRRDSSRQPALSTWRAVQAAPTLRSTRVVRTAAARPRICASMPLAKDTTSALWVSTRARAPQMPNTKGRARPKVEGRATSTPSTRKVGAQASTSASKPCTAGRMASRYRAATGIE